VLGHAQPRPARQRQVSVMNAKAKHWVLFWCDICPAVASSLYRF
jgi:hypothetical protein